jgi:magnesium-transporting ATPase (P-type)
MERDDVNDLKDAWTQYDKKLSEQLKFNEELLRKLNMSHSKREMQSPLLYEITGIAVAFLMIVFVMAYSVRYMDEPKYSIPGFIAAAVGLVYFIFAVIRAGRFLSIDYYGSPVLKVQKDLILLNKLVLRLRKYELILLPALVLPLLPLLFKVIHNIDIYQNLPLLLIEVVLILGIGYPLTFWINKQIYDKKFKNAERLLSELQQFEKEK